MSNLFDGSQTNDPVVPDQEPDYLEYVKSKFANDKGEVDLVALAKAKFKADQHIAQVEREQAGLRDELKNRTSFEEMLEQIKSAQSSQVAPTNHVEPPTQGDASPKLTEEDYRRLAQETYKQETQKAEQQRNVDTVKQELTKAWGPDFSKKLNEVIQDLELTQDEAANVAATRPKAFLKLVLGSTPQTQNYAPPASSVRLTNSGPDVGVKNNEYFEKIRKTDPVTYWSPKVQNELHTNARKMGLEAFYRK